MNKKTNSKFVYLKNDNETIDEPEKALQSYQTLPSFSILDDYYDDKKLTRREKKRLKSLNAQKKNNANAISLRVLQEDKKEGKKRKSRLFGNSHKLQEMNDYYQDSMKETNEEKEEKGKKEMEIETRENIQEESNTNSHSNIDIVMEKLDAYKQELLDAKKDLEDERTELMARFANAEDINRKDIKRNMELAKQIKDIKEELAIFNKLDLYTDTNNYLIQLSKRPNLATKTLLIQPLKENLNQFEKRNLRQLLMDLDINADENTDIDEITNSLETRKHDLLIELRMTKLRTKNKRSNKIKVIEKDIENVEYKLTKIKEYNDSKLSDEEITKDIKVLSGSKTKKADKEVIINKYQNIIENQKNDTILTIADIFNIDTVEKTTFKSKVKRLSNKLSTFINRNKPKMASICGTTILITTLLGTATTLQYQNNEDDLSAEDQRLEQEYENYVQYKENLLGLFRRR